MNFVTPNSQGLEEIDAALVEMNDCHAPDSGRFCSGASAGGHKQKIENAIGVYKGVGIHALPGYDTPYYYADHPKLGPSKHSTSYKSVKGMISRAVGDDDSTKKHLGTLTNLGWKPGVHPTPPDGARAGITRPWLVVTKDATYSAGSQKAANTLYQQLTGTAPVAKHASAAYRIRKPSDDEAKLLRQAGDDWAKGRAYIDNAGNYRLRSGGARTPTSSSRGQVAPWNKTVKRRFKSSDHFHNFATRSGPLMARRDTRRSTSSRFV